jgi:hypothetical protein
LNPVNHREQQTRTQKKNKETQFGLGKSKSIRDIPIPDLLYLVQITDPHFISNGEEQQSSEKRDPEQKKQTE